MERDEPEERGGLGDAFLGMHAAGPRGPGAAAPGAFWELFCGEKFPAGGRGKASDMHVRPQLLGPLTHLFGCAAREWVQLAFACRFRAPVPGG